MKKSVFLLAIFMLPILSFAYDAEIDGIYYNLVKKAKQAEVTSGDNKYSGVINIPEEVTYDGVIYTVNKICDNAFYKCTSLNSIYIPGSVKEIGTTAFFGCWKLYSVHMEYGIEKIGANAFNCCTSLKTIEIPSSVLEIGGSAFADQVEMTVLEKVIIQDLVSWCNVKFGGNPFGKAHHLYLSGNVDQEVTNLIIPEGVTNIGDNSFSGCSYLTSISIPNSVTSIGGSAFSGCTGLTSLTIPNSVTSIGGSAFTGCTGLTSLTFPNSVTTIGGSAFSGCTGLTSITIPNSVTSIDNNAFAKCPNFEDVYCYKEDPALSGGWGWDANSIFSESMIEYATLHVPSESIDSYKSTAPWSGFGKIVSLTGEEEKEQCAAPTISYANGTLTFACATKEAKIEYNYTISANGSGTAESGGVKPKYTLIVKAWANAEGYDTSDTVTATFESSDTGSGNKGDVNEDGVVNISDVVKVINIMAGDE